MQETTPEQSARLQSFAEQRDVLQGEVTSLTKEKDTLSAVNKELTQTNASLVAEIASNDNKLKNYLDGIQEQVEAAYAQKRIADNERIEAESKAKSALRELDLIVGLVSNLKDMTSGVENTAAEINGNLDNDNIKTGANISGTKLGALTTPLSALDANGRGGWITGVLAAPNTVTYNGNRNYSLVFNSTDYTDEISPGMRLKATRTVTAPTQCTDLEAGSTQYYNKTSPSGMTFTDDFVVSAWIKLESYGTNIIASRFNGTSGWQLYLDANGRLTLAGYNAGAGNTSYVISYSSVPLGKWVHIAAQLDMSSFTATTTTSYIMFDGVDVAEVPGVSQ